MRRHRVVIALDDWVANTFDLTYLLRPSFAATPGEAHARIVHELQTAEVVSLPVVDQDWPVRYDSRVV